MPMTAFMGVRISWTWWPGRRSCLGGHFRLLAGTLQLGDIVIHDQRAGLDPLYHQGHGEQLHIDRAPVAAQTLGDLVDHLPPRGLPCMVAAWACMVSVRATRSPM